MLATGERLRLRMMGLDDVELIDAWAASPEVKGEFNDFDLPHQSVRESVEQGRTMGEGGGTALVEQQDGTPIGTVTWHGVKYGPNIESRAWNIGISLIPAARGRGFGADAQRLLAAYLFANTAANRIEASTDVANVPEQRALARAGFVREGVQRGAQRRHDAWHDLLTFAVTRPQP